MVALNKQNTNVLISGAYFGDHQTCVCPNCLNWENMVRPHILFLMQFKWFCVHYVICNVQCVR